MEDGFTVQAHLGAYLRERFLALILRAQPVGDMRAFRSFPASRPGSCRVVFLVHPCLLPCRHRFYPGAGHSAPGVSRLMTLCLLCLSGNTNNPPFHSAPTSEKATGDRIESLRSPGFFLEPCAPLSWHTAHRRRPGLSDLS